jgi:AcrR family transcriptional regulator
LNTRRTPLGLLLGFNVPTVTTVPDRPRRADAIRNRELVLDAAEALFAERGLRVQLDEVAVAAGVGVGTVCRHFPTKDDLVEQVLNRARTVLIEQAEHCLAMDDAGAGFRRFVVVLVDFQSRYRALAEEMASRPNPTEDTTSLRHRAFEMITALVVRAQAAGELRADLGAGDIAVLFAGIAHATTLTAHLERNQRDRFVTVLLDGLRPDGASPLPGHPMTLTDLVR